MSASRFRSVSFFCHVFFVRFHSRSARSAEEHIAERVAISARHDFRAALRSKPRGASRFRSVSFSCHVFVRMFSSA